MNKLFLVAVAVSMLLVVAISSIESSSGAVFEAGTAAEKPPVSGHVLPSVHEPVDDENDGIDDDITYDPDQP